MKHCTAGESHGPALLALVSDVPAGFALSSAAINSELARRQSGYGRGGRMQIENDKVEILSGVRFGFTLGTPIALQIANRDWENWSSRMAAEGDKPTDLVKEQSPRPGHADLVGAQKIGTQDCRDVLERASARETAARVAAGAVAKAYLKNFGVEIISFVTRIGNVEMSLDTATSVASFSAAQIEASAVRCPHAETSVHMVAAIDAAREAGESLGGWFVLVAKGMVPGLGGYAEASERLTGRIGGALFSIPAIKGVEFGLGFAAGMLVGSRVHDPITLMNSKEPTGKTQADKAQGDKAQGDKAQGDKAQGDKAQGDKVQGGVSFGDIGRASNNAGGLEGGMTTGEPLVIRAAMKPIPTMTKPLSTIDLCTHKTVEASKERSDVCAVPAAAVVAEAELALVLADAYMDKFGRDTLADALAACEAYAARIARY